MRKFTSSILALSVFAVFSASAQVQTQTAIVSANAETAPLAAKGSYVNNNIKTLAQSDVLFTYDIATLLGGNGKAGVCVVPSGLGFTVWVSNWATDSLFTIELPANVVTAFQIPGVAVANSGVRAMTFDGTNIYASANSTEVFVIDPVTKTAVNSLDFSSVGFNIRALTYDPTANSGAGGFWCSNFATDIALTDMTGALVSTISAGNHGLTAMYGAAYDALGTNGPSIWFHDQGGANTDDIVEVDIATGTQTGVMHDVSTDIPGATGSLAGGLFLTNALNASGALVAMCQSTPNNYAVVYDLAHSTGIFESATQNDQSIFVYPNPVTDFVRVKFNADAADFTTVQIINAQGNVVKEITAGTQQLEKINVQDLQAGIYTVKATGKNKTAVRKITVQ
ncbi:MAG: T9SS type A sorting domain-containing protein [Bacteroidetes bacterium]|nr:T9SS type A sorting domain-containing protein [Bacteroidota bacterium]